MRVSNGNLLIMALSSMLVALACSNVSVASGDYGGVLLTALCAMTVADVCCVVVFRRGGWPRWVAVVIAMPSLFIVWDLLRRAPHAWGLT